MFNQQRLEEYTRQHLDWYHFMAYGYKLWYNTITKCTRLTNLRQGSKVERLRTEN